MEEYVIYLKILEQEVQRRLAEIAKRQQQEMEPEYLRRGWLRRIATEILDFAQISMGIP